MRKKEAQSFYNGIKSSNKVKLTSPADKDSISAAINFAYGDAKRTMTGISKYKTQKNKAIERLEIAFLAYFKNPAPNDWNAFAEEHKELCQIWVEELHEDDNLSTYGKAQKIINMTFKYLYCCETLEGYEEHFTYCHMPLDSFTLEWFKREIVKDQKGIKFSTWSSIKNSDDPTKEKDDDGYQTYNYYIRSIQEYCEKNESKPLLLEFEIWPKIQKHLAAEAFLFSLKESITTAEKEKIRKESLHKKLEEIEKNLRNWK